MKTTLSILGTLALLALFVVFAALSDTPLETFVFYVCGGLMVISSVAIVVSRSIVRSAVWLLGALMAAAGLYFLLSANFLGAIQLIVYAGGILILIVFGVMLTARSPSVRFNARPREIAVAILASVVLFGGLNPHGAMRVGTPDEVREETRAVVEAAKGRRLILSTGTGTTPEATLANQRAMVEEAQI